MAATTVVPLTEKSQKAFIAYYDSLQNNQNTFRSTSRSRMEAIDKAYQREVDLSKENQDAKRANKAGDPTKYQNMTIPVVMPQVESAVVYQSSVFLTGYPMFGVVASPEYMDEAVMLETLIDNDAVRGGWTTELLTAFRDGFKYNLLALECAWDREVTYAVETNLAKSTVEGIPKEVLWAGNKIKRLDPYNLILDPRVHPTDIAADGEYAGYTEYMSRIKLKSFIATLTDKIITNIPVAFASGSESGLVTNSDSKSFYIPSINPEIEPDSYQRGGTNWLNWAGLIDDSKRNMEYKDCYELTTLYCRVMPSEFGIKAPKENTPQIYKLYIVNHKVIIYCELQTNAHNLIPILIGQPNYDGLGYQTKSLAKNAVPFQELATAFMAANIASKRRAVSDRQLYDPSRVDARHINSENPSAKIPVRPSAYGKPLNEAVYAFPYRDDQAASSMQQISAILGLANSLNGQNQAQQGQFVKGNKTLHEYESVMQNANGRDQMVSILLEAQLFTPMKQIIKLNLLQYQGGTTLYNRDKDVAVEIDPIKLRTAVLNFKVSDGLTPTSKLINSDSLSMALQVLGSSPQIANGYNIAPLFSYFMKTQGAKITEFEKSAEQLAYEQALSSWQQLMQLAIEKGTDPTAVGAQPVPASYNYNPQNNKPAPKEAQFPSGQDTGVTA